MLFPTATFATFFVIVYLLHWFTRHDRVLWKVCMTAASLVFYGWWNWRFVGLIGASIVGNGIVGLWLGQVMTHGRANPTSRWIVRGAVTANLAVLAWFKYAGFLVYSVWNPLPGPDAMPAVVDDIVLPVGISFFTFQAMSYVIDIGRGDQRPRPLLDVAVYLSFFAQLVAGPIVRGTEFLPQIDERTDPRRVHFAPAFWLIGVGLAKKVVVSSYLAAEIVDPVFAAPLQHSSWEVLWGVLGYSIQIYADFSGYTDIAIGVALLLGFRFPQNFDSPYTAVTIQDFWRRWHMTLSRWLRDYLYIPLGGSRGTDRATYRNLMLTMLLGGLWHGAAWTFVIWGAIHGGVQALERWRTPTWPPIVGRVVTYAVVCIAWVFFRAPNLDTALDVLVRLGQPWVAQPHGGASLVHPLVIVAVVVMLASQYVPRRSVRAAQDVFGRAAPLVQGVALGVALLAIDSLGPEGVAPFIYFQF